MPKISALPELTDLKDGDFLPVVDSAGLITKRVSLGALADYLNPKPWWHVEDVPCVVAYQPKGAASYAASLADLSGNGNDGVAYGSDPASRWSPGAGWMFDADNLSHVDTGVAIQSEFSVIVGFNGLDDTNAAILFGLTQAYSGLYILSHPTMDRMQFGIGNPGIVNYFSPARLTGVTGTAFTADTVTFFLRGLLGDLQTATKQYGYSLFPTIPIFIGAQNFEGNETVQHTLGNIYAFSAYSGALSGEQIEALVGRMLVL